MSTRAHVNWSVLLDENEWESEQGEAPPSPTGEWQTQPNAPRRAVISRASVTGLVVALLLTAGILVWESVQLTGRPSGAATRHRPPVSADVLAAHATALVLTEHLRIQAQGTDIEDSAATAQEMEALYLNLFATVGVPPVHGNEAPDGRLLVVLRGTHVPRWHQAQGWVALPSPARGALSVQTNRQVWLRQAWLSVLSEQATRDASQLHQIPTGWMPLLGGLRLWLLVDANGPLAEGWGEVVAGLYDDESGYLSPGELQVICRKYAVWDVAPIDFSIPLGCGPTLPILPAIAQLARLRLPESFETVAAQGYTLSWPMTTARHVAVAQLIEYAVDSYGRGIIPRLLAALRDHSSWQTLIPAVFDVSAEEFEAGWQAWLAEKYGL